jgi:transcriptional regulator GlxA family with amidase domain
MGGFLLTAAYTFECRWREIKFTTFAIRLSDQNSRIYRSPIANPNGPVQKWITETSVRAEYVMAVCTGTVLLATTGLLDGRRATTNKKDYRATIPYGPKVNWVPQARWVEDGKFFTSSGVSAGMDMSLAVMSKMFGEDAAEFIAVGTEYDWHKDPNWDPFAKLAGLV